MELNPFLLTSRWVRLSSLATSRLVMDKDWTTEGQRSLLTASEELFTFYKNPERLCPVLRRHLESVPADV